MVVQIEKQKQVSPFGSGFKSDRTAQPSFNWLKKLDSAQSHLYDAGLKIVRKLRKISKLQYNLYACSDCKMVSSWIWDTF